MTDVERLLREYISEHHGGGRADPREYVERLEGADRKELATLIDGYLERAPRQEWDREAYEQSAAPKVVEALSRSLTGSAGLWPSVLPRLRERARVKRSEVVGQLAARLGASGGQRDKVAAYYHEMEQGSLPASGVSDRVLEALGEILGQSAAALRRAGGAFGRPPPTSPATAPAAFARKGMASPGVPPADASEGPPAEAEPEQWDEVDRLFRGG